MAPIITSGGQTRSRLPTKWMQSASTKFTAAPTTTKPVDPHVSPQESPMRWSTHTLAADPHDTIRSRADSIASTYVDTFAHRRKNRISDLTFVDHFDETALPSFPHVESHASDLNDASLTLNNDDDSFDPTHPTPYEQDALTINQDYIIRCDGNSKAHFQHDDAQYDHHDLDDDDEMAQRINRLMAATMEALEASNRLVLDTLSSRAKLAQLNAMEAALDSHLDAREAHLQRQIQAVNDMTDFVSKTSAELQKLTGAGPSNGLRVPSGVASTSQLSTLADAADLQVKDAAATGIVQALDRDATIGKTAAKRLERMLQTPSPTASPKSPASANRKSNHNNSAARRAFSISNFASVQSSIAEEMHIETEESSVTPSGGPGESAMSPGSHMSTPQKKRSISYDSRAPGAIKLMGTLAAPAKASTSHAASSSTALSGLAATSDAKADSNASGSTGAHANTVRPSLMAALRQDPTLASSKHSSLLSNSTIREESSTRPQTKSTAGLPSYSGSVNSKATASVGLASSSIESTLAALLGMPSTAASTSSRTETPSDSSYFDSAMDDSISSASPPTPGSVHAIHGVLATPWKPAAHEGVQDSADAAPSTQERCSRRTSVYSNMLSPRASLSLSDRDRAQQLSSQLAELRAERVTWNPQSVGSSAESGAAGSSTSASGGGGGGGALRALQKLNEMSAAKIAGQGSASAEDGGSKRVSLGLGLPSFSALRPSVARSASTNANAAAAVDAASSASPVAAIAEASAEASSSVVVAEDAAPSGSDAATPSLLVGGWRSWASWNTASAPTDTGETRTAQK